MRLISLAGKASSSARLRTDRVVMGQGSSQPNKALKFFSLKLYKIKARSLDFLVQNVSPLPPLRTYRYMHDDYIIFLHIYNNRSALHTYAPHSCWICMVSPTLPTDLYSSKARVVKKSPEKMLVLNHDTDDHC